MSSDGLGCLPGQAESPGQLKSSELETEKFPGLTTCLILWLHVLPAAL